MSALAHLGVHLMNNKAIQTVAAGAAVGPAAVATGSALTAVGATVVGTVALIAASGYGAYKFVKWLASD